MLSRLITTHECDDIYNLFHRENTSYNIGTNYCNNIPYLPTERIK